MLRHMRRIGGETARALIVLALIFLNFAHTSVAAPPASQVLMAQTLLSLCGDAAETAHYPGDSGAAHAPCHACRIGNGADLPPPPCQPIGRLTLAGAVDYLPAPSVPGTSQPVSAAHPRAPPARV